jgi:hypothetical protein
MISAQKHIIHQVIVDVETKNERVAFQLKDTIDVFLKEEIFPSLEGYFESLEDEFQTQTIQISKLELTINSTSKNDFRELKEDIKKEAFKELKKVIKSPKIESENIAFFSSAKNDERALIYFLEKGTPPWRNGSNEAGFLKEKKLIEICRSTSFIKLFREKIAKENVQNRFINQFLDEEIQTLLESAFHIDAIKKSIISNEIIEKFEALTPPVRKSIWKIYIDYFLNKNERVFLEKLVELTRFEKIKKNQKKTVKKLIEIIRLISQENDEKPSREIVQEHLNSEQYFLKGRNENTISFDSKNSIEKNEEKLAKIEADIDGEIVIKFIENKKINEEDEALNFNLKKPKENTKVNRSENAVVNEGLQNEFKPENSSVTDDLGNAEIKSSQDENEVLHLENKELEPDGSVEKSDNSLSKLELEKQNEIEFEKAVSGELKFIENEQRELEEITLELGHEKQREEVVSKELKTDEISKRNKASLEDGEGAKNTNDLLSKSEKENASKLDADSETKGQENTTPESLKEEIYSEEKGEYYIQNTGLILLHPYLKDFFFNCDLLSDDSKILDPELAIHLLHYVATKKEKQFESNMVFEKFLCGVPIQKTIRRNIHIPNELKQKSEELLEGVIANWTSLNNASPDLLRNEFLQRSGKISFKDDNPKIVVERKVYDILLDKIPWTLSICKLPWISKLIFTDW